MEPRNRESVVLDRTVGTGRQASLMEVSVAVTVFAFDGSVLRVLVVKSLNPEAPLRLPRYSFQSGLSLRDAAALAVRRYLPISSERFQQVGAMTFPPEGDGNPAVDVGFFAAACLSVDQRTIAVHEGSDEEESTWVSIGDLSLLDPVSQKLVENAVIELRRRARFESVVFALLPEEFSLSELQRAFEVVIGRSIDVRNFRKKMEALRILIESPHKPRGMAHRPPRLFSFSPALFEDRLKRETEIRFF